MAWKLYIDSSDRNIRKVVLSNTETNETFEKVSEKGGITELIQELLDFHKVSLGDISEISSNPGPGSFTGLKSGAVAANVLNWVLGKKSISELALPEYGGEPNIHTKSDIK